MPLSDAWVDFLAGWCSGAVAVLAVQPVDTVLTRWQAGLITTTVNTTAATATTSTVVAPTAATAAAATTTTATTTTTTALLRNMTTSLTRSFGYTALWRGSSPMIGAVPIQNALLMGGYGIGLQYADNHSNNNTNNNSNEQQHHRYLAIFVGGCTGGILQSFLMSPVELVKVSQQCSPQQLSLRTASLPVVVNLTRFSTRAWTGLGATLLRDGIPHGVWFMSYEMCKREMQAWQGSNNDNDDVSSSSIVIPLVSGAVAATTAWAVGYPFDLIKTRIQSRAGSTKNSISLGIIGTAQELIQQANGRVIAGLYRGFGLKLVRSVPASMIGFTVYEMVKKQVLESL